MKLKQQLIVMLVPIVILVTALTMFVTNGIKDEKAKLETLVNRDVVILKESTSLINTVNTLVPLIDKIYIKFRKKDDFQQGINEFKWYNDSLITSLNRLKSIISSIDDNNSFDYSEQVFYDELSLEFEINKNRYISAYENYTSVLDNSSVSLADFYGSHNTFRAEAIALGNFLRNLNIKNNRQFKNLIGQIIQHVNKNYLYWIILMALIFLIGIIVAVYTVRNIGKPLNQLKKGVSEISRGNLNFRLDERNESEFGVILQEFNNMASKLGLAQSEIGDKNEELLVINRHLNAEKQKAESADRLKSTFLANMSHEIRTPMNGIVGFTEMLDDEELTNEERKEYRSIIKVCSNQLMRIIDDILDFSKLDAGQMKLVPEQVKLSTLVQRVEKIYEHSNKIYPGVDLQFECHALKNDDVITDPKRLSQIIINLLDNALKFTHEGFVKVSLERVGDHLSLKVKDTGIGISPEQQDHIFDRFTQVEENNYRMGEKGGTGLGLSIVKALADLMNGKITLTSKEGEGSEFHVLLKCEFIDNASSYSDTSR